MIAIKIARWHINTVSVDSETVSGLEVLFSASIRISRKWFEHIFFIYKAWFPINFTFVTAHRDQKRENSRAVQSQIDLKKGILSIVKFSFISRVYFLDEWKFAERAQTDWEHRHSW